jgi:hypothetical protein
MDALYCLGLGGELMQGFPFVETELLLRHNVYVWFTGHTLSRHNAAAVFGPFV